MRSGPWPSSRARRSCYSDGILRQVTATESRLAGVTAALILFITAAPSAPVIGAQAVDGARFTARVLANHDGDTFTSADRHGRRATVRLYGVDAPENRQDGGIAAKAFLAKLIVGKQVEIYPGTVERSGRLVARVVVDGADVSVAVLRGGHGWHSTEFSRDPLLADAERTARQAKAGLWAASNPVPPWVFRRSGRQPASRAASKGPFHGNVRSFVYHARGCREYTCRTCTRTFETKAAADAAGFRAHATCVR